MKLIKRMISAAVAVLMIFGAACTKKDGDESETAPAETTAAETGTPAPEKYTGRLSVDVRPVPVSAVISDRGEDSADASLLSLSSDEYGDIFGSFGFETGEGGLPVTVTLDPGLSTEEYELSVKADGAEITASGRRGVFLAVSTMAQLRFDGRIAAAEISDKPAVPFRGVIEGFYGKAWTHDFRLDLFRFMGRYKLNTYIYAPKDDPKHRAQWRELYTGGELQRMKELIDCATENNVRFVYAISPGLDIDLGSGYEKDLSALFEKCGSVYELGVRDFAILLDDINTHDAKGHAALVNDFQNKFVRTHEGCGDLIMISPEFCAAMLTGYTDELSPLIDPDIMVMWTGNGVVPASITAKDLRSVNKKFGRNVFIWWNYPVNDTMADQLFLGPCENLDKALPGSISGLVSNPMNQGYASMIPLMTVADYLWDPEAYDPEASVRAAVSKLAPECSDGLYALYDLTRDSLINDGKTAYLLRDEIKAYTDGKEGAPAALSDKLDRISADLMTLLSKGDKRLVEETDPWLRKALSYVDALRCLVRFDASGNDRDRAENALSFVSAYGSSAENTSVVSPDVIAPLLASARARINSVTGGSEAAEKSLSTDLQTYQSYVLSNVSDGDEATFFWSAGAPAKNSFVTLDLGSVADITYVRLLMADAAHADDYIHSGVLEYSTDGVSFTRLCDVTGRDVSVNENVSARYLRVRSTGTQQNWVIIREFSVKTAFSLPAGVSFDGDPGTDFSAMFDRNIFSAYTPSASVAGKTLKVDVSGVSGVTLLLASADGLRVYTEDGDGSRSEITELSGYTRIDTEAVRYIYLEFAGSPAVAELITE